MRWVSSCWLFLLLTAGTSLARPVERGAPLRFPISPTIPITAQSPPAAETYYFGGTVWAADSMRWEAIPESVWTFETGVGSHFQHTDPNKNPAFHASMEGWTGVDLSATPSSQRFRRLSPDAFPPNPSAVGSAAGLGGMYSFWAGLLEQEADSLCWAAGQGYGNNWNICLFKDFQYDGSGCLRLAYSFYNETEGGFDYTYVMVDTSGPAVPGGNVVATFYTGIVDGTSGDVLDLSPGVDLPQGPGPIRISFCVTSDGGYSDEDGLNPTTRGAFAVDDIVISNAGCAGGLQDESTFESDEDGWSVETRGDPSRIGGDWSRLAAVADLPLPDTLDCDLGDSVLVMFNPDGAPHPLFQDNMAVSPWIDLRRAGLVGYPGKFVEMGGYRDLPLSNYIFVVPRIQWYPDLCEVTGKIRRSNFTQKFFFFTPDSAWCGTPPSRIDFDDVVPLEAEQIRISVGVVNWCRFFSACNGESNASPWFDRIRFGVSYIPTNFNLQGVIDAAAEGDTIWVSPGTYVGSGDGGLDFGGTNLVLKSTDGPEATIIDGANVSRGILFQSGEDSTSVVEGFTIRNCTAPQGQYSQEDGGGIYITNGSPTIRDCIIEENSAHDGGGLAVVGPSTPHLEACRFEGNSAQYRGGGVVVHAPLRMSSCTLEGNTAYYGAGLYLGTNSEINDCTFRNNQAGGSGGGISCAVANQVITDCTIEANTASESGGGIDGPVSLVRCLVADNHSDRSGGGFWGQTGTFLECTFTGNTADEWGGGLWVRTGTLTDCVISGNTAWKGGGITFSPTYYGTATATGCLITGNLATSEGGGVQVRFGDYETVFEGCTFSANRAIHGGAAFVRPGGFARFSHSILWGNCADSTGAAAVLDNNLSVATFLCCAVLDEEIAGGGVPLYEGPQVSEPPLFCGAAPCTQAPTSAGNYSLASASLCLPAASPCGVLIGARGEGCTTVAAPAPEEVSPVNKPRLLARPNPFRESVTLEAAVPDGAAAALDVFDVQGRLVRRLPGLEARGQLAWDGLDDRGIPVRAGVYFIRLRAGAAQATVRVVRLR